MKFLLSILCAFFFSSGVAHAAKVILIVDDSSTLRQIVSTTLKGYGYQVAEAAEGADALKLIKQRGAPFDLIITDINMPVMSGWQLITQIRSIPQYNRTPILILSTESSAQAKARGKSMGANGWLVKPFDTQYLIGVVNKMIGK